MNQRKSELLAPAGNMNTALSAFDAGADAVYCGLDKFNARERGVNFKEDELARLCAYAHKNGRKVYVTLNTLVKESELEEAAAMIADIQSCRADAVIVQDIGVLRIIREYFPELRIHASTQMGIHNSDGVAVAASMGVSRVILERQISMDEISAIASKSPVELEVFIHGAMCCSLSGTCLFSSWSGGHSGNRGKCRQPCRRRFQTESGERFVFSMKDLAVPDYIPELMRMGIASFKIEGRLKNPDYVRKTVEAYRKIIDGAGEAASVAEAGEILKRTPGRKSLSGFMNPGNFSVLTSPDEPGVPGIFCGIVESVGNNTINVKLSDRIHAGDSLRIQSPAGDEGPALTVSTIRVDGQNQVKAFAGQTCVLRSSKNVSEGDLVYRIGESCRDMSAFAESLPLPPLFNFDFELTVSSDGLSCAVKGLERLGRFSAARRFEKASKKPVSAAQIIDEFMRMRNEAYQPGLITVNIVDPDIFIPASVLKELRKQIQDSFESAIDFNELKSPADFALENFKRAYSSMHRCSDTGKPVKTAFASVTQGEVEPGLIYARDIFESFSSADEEVVLPQFCPEDKLELLRKRIGELYENGHRAFRLRSLYSFFALKELQDVKIHCSFPFPVANSIAGLEAKALGASRVQIWLELDKLEMENFHEKSPVELEFFRKGRIPLLVTRAILGVKELKGFNEDAYTIKYDEFSALSFLMPDSLYDPGESLGELSEYEEIADMDLPAKPFNYRGRLA